VGSIPAVAPCITVSDAAVKDGETMNTLKAILVVLLGITAFTGLTSLAVFWHGALFILLLGPFVWALNWWLSWSRR
jgi:hypothetical protein